MFYSPLEAFNRGGLIKHMYTLHCWSSEMDALKHTVGVVHTGSLFSIFSNMKMFNSKPETERCLRGQ